MSNGKGISAAEAAKLFKHVKVRVSKLIQARGEDNKVRPTFKVNEVALAEEHIIGVARNGDRVVIATINGEKHEATA